MDNQAILSQGDTTAQVVSAHKQLLCNNYPIHYRKFEKMLASDRQAAIAEAVVFALLKKLRLNPEPFDAPGAGGLDFKCHPEGREQFFVEVTSLREETVEKKSGLPRKVEDQWEGSIDGGSFLRGLWEKVESKAQQAKKVSEQGLPVVAVLTTSHALADWILDLRRVEELLTGRTGLRWGTGLVTDLEDTIFLQADGDRIVARRKAISAILLVVIRETEYSIHGILHPEPDHVFDISNFPHVPFLKMREWPIRDGEIKVEWVIDQPRPWSSWHKALKWSQSSAGDQITELLEAQFDEITHSWYETTLSELALNQNVQPIHHLEEVLGKGENLWNDAREFEDFVHDVYRRREEDREKRA